MDFARLLVSNTFYRVFNIGILFLITILLSRIAGVSGFGIISLMIANATIFNLFSSLGSDASSTYFTIKGLLSPQKIITLLLTLIILQLVLIFFIEVLLYYNTNSFWLTGGQKHFDLILSTLFCLSISVIDKISALLHGEQKVEITSKTVFYSNLTLLLILFVLNFLGIKNFYFCLSIYVLSFLIQASALTCFYYKIKKHSFQISFLSKEEIKLFFSFSFLIYLINTIQFVAYRIDFWFINYYRGEEELGWYSLSVRLAQLFWIIPNIISVLVYPKIAAGNNGSKLDMPQIIRVYNVFNLIVGLVLYFLSSWFIPFFFGKSYETSILSFRILVPGVCVFSISSILASYFAGINKLRVNLAGSLICLCLILLLDALLIPKYGLVGASIASTIGYSLTTLYFIRIYSIHKNIKVLQMIKIKKSDLVSLKVCFHYFINK